MNRSAVAVIALGLAFTVLVYPTASLALETGTAAEGTAAGRADGERDTDWILWLAAGCLLGPVGLGAAFLMQPDPPASRLLGKSSEYVAAYTDAYRDSAREYRTEYASVGLLASVSACTLCCFGSALVAEEGSSYSYVH